ncbi:MAG: hypothetical protein A2W19_03095 [Spirochaetes bacterium RBG_16_49_21]|nr:MAG: hypothetical protein A2W19_03095 [Spirochaetes bacterium RBG_16_49_21]
MFDWIRDRAALIKMPVSLMSGCAALFGFSLYAWILSPAALWTGLGVFCLSAGAAGLNSFQDRVPDSLMARTRQRPLPAGRITPLEALIVSSALICCGIAALCLTARSIAPSLAGLSAVILYNGLYTPFKLRTQLALIPGVICGMLPPLIGWLAAGGGLASTRIWYIMAFFGTWQVPHFWLVFLSYSADFRRSGIPMILDTFSERQLKRLVFLWALSYAVLMLFVWPFSIIKSGVSAAFVLVNALAVPLVFLRLLYKAEGAGRYRRLFNYLNATTLGVMCIAIFDCVLAT